MEPKILVGTPWNIHVIHTQFMVHMMNMEIPYPRKFSVAVARHISDARNTLCAEAVEGGYSHVFMVDADTHPPQDAFNRLWKVLNEFGHGSTVAWGWVILRTGQFAGKPGIFRSSRSGDGLEPIDDIQKKRGPFKAEACGTACVLIHTGILKGIQQPWFSDLFVIGEDEEAWSEDEEKIIYRPTEFRLGQDLTFSSRLKYHGISNIVDPGCKLPHEFVGTV